MSEQKHVENCKQCNVELSSQYCPDCGRPQNLKRISGQYILSEIGSVFNFEKGIFFTIKELLIRPGTSVRRFFHEDRNRLVKPISFIILCSLVYIVAQQTLNFKDGYINFSDMGWGDTSVTSIMKWITNNYGFSNILMAIFIAFWVKLFFKKYDYNFFEILILLCFIIGIQMLLFAVLGIFESVSHLKVLDRASPFVFIYICWAIGQFFDGKKKINYLKVFICYMLGLVSFIFFAIASGLLIDLIIK